MGFRKEDHRDKAPLSFYNTRGTCSQSCLNNVDAQFYLLSEAGPDQFTQCKIIFLFSTLSTWDVPIWDQCMASRGFDCTFFRLKHLHKLFGILHEGCISHSLTHLLIYQHRLTTMSVSCTLFCNLRMHFYYADQVVLVLPTGSLFC